ncbi:MAG: endonuclease/exonuclease/phosphatase family metal-dependent hydrolase [Patiriisocius sp.]
MILRIICIKIAGNYEKNNGVSDQTKLFQKIQMCFFAIAFLVNLSFTSPNANIDYLDSSEKSITAMTYNIRFDIPGDENYNWDERRNMISQTISSNSPDVMGVQEAYYNQIKWLEDELKVYEWYAVGGEDGEFRGEYCAIFFQKEKYELLDSGTYWLAEDDAKPGSLAWDSEEPSVMTCVKLKMKSNGETIFVFNTRLGETDKAKIEGSKKLLEKIGEIAKNNSFILTGDFNSEPEHKSIQLIKEHCKEAKASCFINASDLDYTLIFDDNGNKVHKRQDYVFFSDNFPVNSYEVLNNTFNKKYPSDHLPVLCRLRLP